MLSRNSCPWSDLTSAYVLFDVNRGPGLRFSRTEVGELQQHCHELYAAGSFAFFNKDDGILARQIASGALN